MIYCFANYNIYYFCAMQDIALIDTTIQICGISFYQPVSAFTDFVITCMACFFYCQLYFLSIQDKGIVNWKRFFLCICISSFLGGASHGFFQFHEGVGYKLVWLSMQFFGVAAVFFAQQATLNTVLVNSSFKAYWNIIYFIQLLLFIPAIFIFQGFLVIVVNSIIGLVPIIFIHFFDKNNLKDSRLIASGIIILFFSGLVNALKVSIHPYFNHIDIAHVLVMFNLSVMYFGVKRKAISLRSS